MAEEKRYIGIDIGGMTIKGIVTDGEGNTRAEDVIETGARDGGVTLVNNVVTLVNRLILKDGGEKSVYCGVGIGSPGLIDSKNGVVVFSGNLALKNFALAQKVSEQVDMPVKLVNDANAAALGEAKFGAGKLYEDSVLVTLGTGVGGGVVIGGKLFEGYKSAGTELGHMVIVEGGLPCTCGRKGCFEAYSSASALMKMTKITMHAHKDSAMWQTYTPQTVNGKTPFEYMDTDVYAKAVVEWYAKYLACGLLNIANIFRPQVIMLGGGVSEQGERLLAPVREIFEKELFAGSAYAPVLLVKATLGSKAGAFGAAALFM